MVGVNNNNSDSAMLREMVAKFNAVLYQVQ
jgi:hypothetical protein